MRDVGRKDGQEVVTLGRGLLGTKECVTLEEADRHWQFSNSEILHLAKG